MKKSTRREFLKQTSASLMALALLPILPSGDKFMVLCPAHGEELFTPVSLAKEGWCLLEWRPLEKLNFGEIVMDKDGDMFIFDGALRSLYSAQ